MSITPRRLLRWIAHLVLLYLGLVLLAWLFQRKLIYFPAPGPVERPLGMTYQRLEDVAIRTEDGETLRAWYWPGEQATTIVVFHGNAGHRGHRLPWIAQLRDLGVSVLIFDYRGYGGSSGSPSEAGLYRDGEAVLAWLRGRGITDLVYLGQSLGSGVAVEMARRHEPHGLILQGAFTSLADVSAAHYPFLPARWLLADHFDNLAKVAAIGCPVLVLHAERDEVVPHRLGEALARRAGARFATIEGATHDTLAERGGRRYEEELRTFLAPIAPIARPAPRPR